MGNWIKFEGEISCPKLVGGNSYIFNFHPYFPGEMIQFDEHIFKMDGSTTNQKKRVEITTTTTTPRAWRSQTPAAAIAKYPSCLGHPVDTLAGKPRVGKAHGGYHRFREGRMILGRHGGERKPVFICFVVGIEQTDATKQPLMHVFLTV